MKKSGRIFTLLVAAALAASMLTACKSKEKETYFEENSKGEIVDSELLEKIEQEAVPLNTKVENYSFHSGKNQVIGHTKITVDDKFLYVYDVMGDQGYVKVDLQSGATIITADYIDRVFFIGDYVDPDDTSKQYDVIASVRSDGSDLWVKKFEGSIYNQR